MSPRRLSALLLATTLLAGCDMLGIESADAVAARKDAEGRAVGGACRHAGRALEDCYAMNRKSDKAAVFAGWREMNDYMRENKIESLTPQGTPATDVAAKPAAPARDAEHDKPADGAKAAKRDS
jgi:hypothetical protein